MQMHNITAIAVFACFLSTEAVAVTPLRVIALTGMPAAGAPANVSFETFGSPVINDTGQVAFTATTSLPAASSYSNGIWVASHSGDLRSVAHNGQVVSHLTGRDTLRTFGRPFLNDRGQLAFRTFGRDGCNQRVCPDGAYMIAIEEQPDQMIIVARERWLPPMPRDSAPLDYFYLNDFNNRGEVVYQGILLAASDRFGVWITNPALEWRVVGRQGDHPPSTPPGTIITSISNSSLDQFVLPLTDSSVTAFIGNTDTPSWIGSGLSDLQVLFARGDSVPGLGVPATFDRLGQPLLSEDGQITFSANFGEGSAIFRGNQQSGFHIVARNGDPAIGFPDGTRISSFGFGFMDVNDKGATVFQALARGAATNGQSVDGIWLNDSVNGTRLIGGAGMSLPGSNEDETLRSVSGRAFINDLGQVVFRASLSGPNVDESNNEGIWIQDQHGQLHLVARKGQVIGGGGDEAMDPLMITDLGYGDRSFNGIGQLALRLAFSDGTQGIFVSNLTAVPEPATWLILLLGGMTSLAKRSRRRSGSVHG
jgi:hypothetical protein